MWTNPTSVKALHDANRIRSESTAAHKVVAARNALRTLQQYETVGPAILPAHHQPYYAALRARVDFPTRSLAEIAAELGITKDQYSARLRRAFEYAQQIGVPA